MKKTIIIPGMLVMAFLSQRTHAMEHLVPAQLAGDPVISLKVFFAIAPAKYLVKYHKEQLLMQRAAAKREARKARNNISGTTFKQLAPDFKNHQKLNKFNLQQGHAHQVAQHAKKALKAEERNGKDEKKSQLS